MHDVAAYQVDARFGLKFELVPVIKPSRASQICVD